MRICPVRRDLLILVMAGVLICSAVFFLMRSNIIVGATPGKPVVVASKLVDKSALGRDVLANAYALSRLGLVNWEEGGRIVEGKLAEGMLSGEAVSVVIRLRGEESKAFSQDYSGIKTPCPDWAKSYIAYAEEKKLLPDGFDFNTALLADDYIEMLSGVYKHWGMNFDPAPFSKWQGERLNRGSFAEITYLALALTEERQLRSPDLAVGSSGGPAYKTVYLNLGEQLLAGGIFSAKEAILADLPVEINTAVTYRETFYNSLIADSRAYVYTAKNNEMLAKFMKDTKMPFIFVNQKVKLGSDFIPTLVDKLSLPAKTGNVYMQPEAYACLTELFTEAKGEGISLFARSGYRSYATQVSLFGKGDNEFRAAPGTSEHQTGLVMDVVNSANRLDPELRLTSEAKWLRDNAHKYGFIIRYPEGKDEITGYPAEWWHLRYLGATLSYEIYEKELTFDEFYDIVTS